jgi:hypothetical protein
LKLLSRITILLLLLQVLLPAAVQLQARPTAQQNASHQTFKGNFNSSISISSCRQQGCALSSSIQQVGLPAALLRALPALQAAAAAAAAGVLPVQAARSSVRQLSSTPGQFDR